MEEKRIDLSRNCNWQAGRDNVKKYGLDGNCEKCPHYKQVGVHFICFASSDFSGRVTDTDVCVMSLRNPDGTRRCFMCKHHFKPKTQRCQECVNTENLDNFEVISPEPEWYKEYCRNAKNIRLEMQNNGLD